MSKPKEPVNPFYVLLALAGGAFVITACGFTVMSLREFSPAGESLQGAPGAMLVEFFQRSGMALLAVEVAIVGIASIAAMWLDSARQKRADAARRTLGTQPSNNEESP